MTVSVSDVVHRFFNDYLQTETLRTADIDVTTAVFEYLGDLGYVGTINDRWLQYAEDNSIPHTGPISMAILVATL